MISLDPNVEVDIVAELQNAIDNHKAQRQKADKIAEGFTTEEYQQLRRIGKQNLHFFAKGILGFDLVTDTFHAHLCAWYMRNLYARFKLILLPRGHYKTTLFTIADPIRAALPNFGDDKYPFNLEGNVRQLICHEIHKQASRFLVQITQIVMGNANFMALYPECVPNPRRQRINLSELDFPRTEHWAEPTFDTMGVGGRSQGKHYNIIHPDDLIGEQARDSITEMTKAKNWFDGLNSFMVNQKTDFIAVKGTRYSGTDLYAHIIEKKKRYLKYIRGAEENGEPLCPELLNAEEIEELKVNPLTWIQYANDATILATGFEDGWLRFYKNYGSYLELGSGELIKTRELDICVLVDPAMQKKGAIVVTGMDHKGRIFILEAMKKNWGLPESPKIIETFFRLNAKYGPRVFAIEDVLFSGLFEPWLKTEFLLRGDYFRIERVKTQGEAKFVRVVGLANYYAAGLIYVDPSMKDFIEEFHMFGATDDYHLHDALAYGPRVWMRPELLINTMEQIQQAKQKLLGGRDLIAGY